jgi:hypothetical protein
MAGGAMFVFKQGSRNAMNNDRDEPKFRQNYERLFKARLPHMDTVEDVMEVLEAQHIETNLEGGVGERPADQESLTEISPPRSRLPGDA